MVEPTPNHVRPPVGELQQFAVHPSDNTCEPCFWVKVKFYQMLKYDDGVTNLKRILTALLNSSGGRIIVRSHDEKPVDRETLNIWKEDLEDILRLFIPCDVCRSCIQFVDYSAPLYMVVKKSQKLITIRSHVNFRWLSGNRTIQDSQGLRDIIDDTQSSPSHDPFDGIAHVRYRSLLNECEGTYVVFQSWQTVTKFDGDLLDDTYKLRFIKDEDTRRSLFALPNMECGGHLVLGVEDQPGKGNSILGQVISQSEEKGFKGFLQDFLHSDTQGLERIWGQEGRLPEYDTDWAIRFIPVCGGPQSERRRLIVISFNHVPGGVFEFRPESYLLSSEGFVVCMHFDEWKASLTNGQIRQ